MSVRRPPRLLRCHRLARVALAACLVLGVPAVLPSPAAGQGEVPLFLAFGDSITHGLGDFFVECDGRSGGYPPRLEVDLRVQAGQETDFVTSGVCGELTSEGLSRIDDVLARHGPRVTLLMEGTNDISDRSISLETIRFNLLEMARKIRAAGSNVLLAPPIPRDPDETLAGNAETEMLSDLLRQEAADRGWPFAETFEGLIGVEDLYAEYYSDPFHPNPDGYGLLADLFVGPMEAALALPPPDPDDDPDDPDDPDDGPDDPGPGTCEKDETTLCLGVGDRFRATGTWEDYDGLTGVARVRPATSDSGFFWFFGPENLELLVKVLDGRVLNGHFWVFFGSLSSVGFEITITDTSTGTQRVYVNRVGEQASFADTTAFPAETGDGPGGPPTDESRGGGSRGAAGPSGTP